MSMSTPARNYPIGMGQAVADRTINRKITRPVSPYTKHRVIIKSISAKQRPRR